MNSHHSQPAQGHTRASKIQNINIDEFSGLLEGPRARGAVTLRGLLAPPWSLRIEANSPLTVITVVKGELHITHDNGKQVSLGPGDVAITRAPGHYTVADHPDTQPTIFILPGQDCRSPDGRSINDEMVRDAPGQAAVLDRLLDMLLIAILRTWFDRKETQTQPWYQAKGDRIVGRVLKMIHQDPAHPWTLSNLAAKVGVSRAALARRFHEVVGEPPMSFLTHWRLALAADLLCDPAETIGTIAERVGYSSAYALNSAFKRVRGISPKDYRKKTGGN